MRLAQQRSFREADSRALMASLGLTAVSEVCPDVVFALDTPNAPDAAPFAVLSPLSRKTWSKSPTDLHTQYLATLIEAGVALHRRGLGLRIAVTQPAMDSDDAHELARALAQRGVGEVPVARVSNVDDYLHAVAGACVVVASRLHAVILALVAGCPVVALSHLPKVDRLMRDAGLGDYCMPLQCAAAGHLASAAVRAANDAAGLRTQVRYAHHTFRTQLTTTFDAVARLALTGAGS
jgi:polysaccharide pyruvyl transferase WcaK-like protein